MGTDDIFKKNRREKKKRTESIRDLAPSRYLIVCEGEETEPNYFEEIRDKIRDKYGERIDVNTPKIDIEGTGRNTNSLVEYTSKIIKRNLPYGHVWVVFDKDSFTPHQFNSAIQIAENKGYKVAWSNECIELWFLLHFEYTNTGIDRNAYKKKLNTYFTSYGINNGKYEKNMDNMYEILNAYGSLEHATKFAMNLEKEHKGKTYSDQLPATNVYKLVNELEEYLK